MMDADKISILQVDDDTDDHVWLAAALEKLNIPHQITAIIGCLDLFKLLGEGNHYDIIFLDINMPMINGKECLKKIKANERYCDIPVIIFTTAKSNRDMNEVYESGAHYYVVKPFPATNLGEILKKIFDIDWKNKPVVPSIDSFVISVPFTGE